LAFSRARSRSATERTSSRVVGALGAGGEEGSVGSKEAGGAAVSVVIA
jgi:hypothetical protein